MAQFQPAYNFTMKYEGGYSNHGADKGGETYKGISRVNNPQWNGWPYVDAAKPLKVNAVIKNDALDRLHFDYVKKNYWDKINLSGLSSQPVANILFDYYFMSGAGGLSIAVKLVNAMAGTNFTKWSNEVVAAINKLSPEQLTVNLIAARKKFYEAIVSKNPSQSVFLNGWLARLGSLQKSLSDAVKFVSENKDTIGKAGIVLAVLGIGLTLAYGRK